MSNHLLTTVLITLACLLTAAAQADTVIKLATVAPKDSIWHESLKRIDERWQALTDGEVRLRIYAGTLGDEEEIMRRIRIGQIA